MYVYVCVFMTLLVLTTAYAAIKTLINIHLYQYMHNQNYFMLCAMFKHTYVCNCHSGAYCLEFLPVRTRAVTYCLLEVQHAYLHIDPLRKN